MVSELANSAGGVFTVLFTIVIAVGMVRVLSQAAGGRIDSASVLQLVVYNALTNLPPLLALSIFVAVLMTLMRWCQDNEMVVWFSSGGRSLLSWIGPVLWFSVPVILAIALLSMVISPWARAQTDLLRTQFRQRDEVSAIAPGRFIESMGGKRVFFIESSGTTANSIGKVFLAEGSDQKESVVTAERGAIELNAENDRYIVLHNGRRYETQKDSAATRMVEFDTYSVRLDIKIDQVTRSSKISAQPLTFLLAHPTPEHQAELLWRISWPWAAFNLALFAIPLACTSPRAGRSLNLIVAALVFILYLNGVSIAESWIEQEKIPLYAGLLGLNGSVLLLTVLFFIRRVYMMRWLPAWLSPARWRRRPEAPGRE